MPALVEQLSDARSASPIPGGRGRADDRRRHRHRADRPACDRSHAPGGGEGRRRAARRSRITACASASAPTRWSSAGWKPGARTRSACTCSTRKHPLIGDPLYGGSFKLPKAATPELVETLRSFKRQALHAEKLEFVHPNQRRDGQRPSAPMPADMQALLATLRADTAALQALSDARRWLPTLPEADWPAPPNVRAFTTLRTGPGASVRALRPLQPRACAAATSRRRRADNRAAPAGAARRCRGRRAGCTRCTASRSCASSDPSRARRRTGRRCRVTGELGTAAGDPDRRLPAGAVLRRGRQRNRRRACRLARPCRAACSKRRSRRWLRRRARSAGLARARRRTARLRSRR